MTRFRVRSDPKIYTRRDSGRSSDKMPGMIVTAPVRASGRVMVGAKIGPSPRAGARARQREAEVGAGPGRRGGGAGWRARARVGRAPHISLVSKVVTPRRHAAASYLHAPSAPKLRARPSHA